MHQPSLHGLRSKHSTLTTCAHAYRDDALEPHWEREGSREGRHPRRARGGRTLAHRVSEFLGGPIVYGVLHVIARHGRRFAALVLPLSSCADLQRVPTAGIWGLACDVFPWR
jgi:hypothetical protein